MYIAILAIVLIFAVFGGLTIFGMKKIKNITEDTNNDSSTDPKIETTQEFLPFKEIKNGVIDMGGHDYVGVLEVTSTNYFLRTDEEQDRIEYSFTRFLNSLSQRIVLYTQTKEMDFSKFLKGVELNIETLKDTNPQLVDMSKAYYEEMLNLPQKIGTSKSKKKYILVPFNGAKELSNLTDEEKSKYSLDELKTKMSIIASSLSPVGVKATPLSTKEIVGLIYSTFNRDNNGSFEDIFNGNHLTPIVNGDNKAISMSDEDLADYILYEAQQKLINELSQHALSGKGYGDFIETLNKMRKTISEDSSIDMGGIDNEEII